MLTKFLSIFSRRRSRSVDSSPEFHHHRVKQERVDRDYERAARHDNRSSRDMDESRSQSDRDRHRRRDNHGESRHRRCDQDDDQWQRDARYDEARERNRRHRVKQEPQDDFAFGGENIKQEDKPAKDKDKPDFKLSGKLTEDANTFRGVVIKYNEPPEARKPKRRWRLYPFKGEESLPILHIHRQSAFLLGRDRKIADIPIDHPSCSKQHAVLQYRMVEYTRSDDSTGRRVRPYVIDLGSANGTFVNNNRIEAQRYVELVEKDVLKFGYSSREYVILHDNVDTGEVDEV